MPLPLPLPLIATVCIPIWFGASRKFIWFAHIFLHYLGISLAIYLHSVAGSRQSHCVFGSSSGSGECATDQHWKEPQTMTLNFLCAPPFVVQTHSFRITVRVAGMSRVTSIGSDCPLCFMRPSVPLYRALSLSAGFQFMERTSRLSWNAAELTVFANIKHQKMTSSNFGRP